MAIKQKLIFSHQSYQQFIKNKIGTSSLDNNGYVGNISNTSLVLLADGTIWTHGVFYGCGTVTNNVCTFTYPINATFSPDYTISPTNLSLSTSWSNSLQLDNITDNTTNLSIKDNLTEGSYLLQIKITGDLYSGVFSYLKGISNDEIILHKAGSNTNINAKIYTSNSITYLSLSSSITYTYTDVTIKIKKLL